MWRDCVAVSHKIEHNPNIKYLDKGVNQMAGLFALRIFVQNWHAELPNDDFLEIKQTCRHLAETCRAVESLHNWARFDRLMEPVWPTMTYIYDRKPEQLMTEWIMRDNSRIKRIKPNEQSDVLNIEPCKKIGHKHDNYAALSRARWDIRNEAIRQLFRENLQHMTILYYEIPFADMHIYVDSATTFARTLRGLLSARGNSWAALTGGNHTFRYITHLPVDCINRTIYITICHLPNSVVIDGYRYVLNRGRLVNGRYQLLRAIAMPPDEYEPAEYLDTLVKHIREYRNQLREVSIAGLIPDCAISGKYTALKALIHYLHNIMRKNIDILDLLCYLDIE